MNLFLSEIFSERRLIILVCFSFLTISHVAIPYLNNGKDFFIFSSWRLFSSGPRESISDISWDEGQSFLYRDHRKEAKRIGINIHTLFYLLNTQKSARLQRDYCYALRTLSKGGPLKIYNMKGPLADHIFKKNVVKNDVKNGLISNHNVISSVEICSG